MSIANIKVVEYDTKIGLISICFDVFYNKFI